MNVVSLLSPLCTYTHVCRQNFHSSCYCDVRSCSCYLQRWSCMIRQKSIPRRTTSYHHHSVTYTCQSYWFLFNKVLYPHIPYKHLYTQQDLFICWLLFYSRTFRWQPALGWEERSPLQIGYKQNFMAYNV